MDPLFERRELKRTVHINSRFMQRNMLQPLLTQLRTDLEGHCSSEGFIQSKSITILSYSIGRTNYIRGGLTYEVLFQADICLPHPGQVFKALVLISFNINPSFCFQITNKITANRIDIFFKFYIFNFMI